MSWRDRDYAREDDAGQSLVGSLTGYGRAPSIVSVLIAVNVVLYILCTVTAGPRDVGPVFRYGAMFTPAVMEGQVWRLLTATYLHWNTFHLLMNMIGLYFLGKPLEQMWGSRRFFAVYTVGGMLGNVFFMILNKIGWLFPGIAAGASGSVLALLGSAAVLFPHAEVMIYFLFPVKIRIVAVVLGIGYLWNIYRSGENAGGDACHITGLAFGVWWAMRGERWWGRSRRMSRDRSAQRVSFDVRVQQRRDDAATIDRILAKVHHAGVSALSESEKRALADATERQRNDDRRFGRTDLL